MNADWAGDALRAAAALVLGACAAATVVVPTTTRRCAVALAPQLGRVGSAALRRILLVAGALALAMSAALIVRPVDETTTTTGSVATLLVAGAVVGVLRRRLPTHRRWRLPRVHRVVETLRRRPARRRAVRTVRHVVDVEIDASIRTTVDLAWWAATATVGSVADGRCRVDAHTVVVPGRRGEVTAVISQTGTLSLLLVASAGPVGGVSVRRTV